MPVSRQHLERLAQLHSESGILSAYLRIDPRLGYDRNQPVAKFKGSLSRFARTADPRWAPVLERERDRVLRFLEDWQPDGRGLVIFTAEPDGIWEVFSLDVMVPSFVSVDLTPHTAVLARVVEEHPRLAVVMLDGAEARVYLTQQGEARETAAMASDIPSRHDQGGWSQARYQRHVEFHTEKHRQKVAQAVEDLFNKRRFRQLVIVGVEEAVLELQAMLSAPAGQTIAGRFSADFKTENDDHILQRAEQALEAFEAKKAAELVSQIAGLAAADGRAVLGIDRAIEAIVEGKVQTLVLAEGTELAGSACPHCGYFAGRRFERCPACDGKAEEMADIVEYAVERAYLAGASVRFVSREAATPLAAAGGMGALLHYTP